MYRPGDKIVVLTHAYLPSGKCIAVPGDKGIIEDAYSIERGWYFVRLDSAPAIERLLHADKFTLVVDPESSRVN